MTPRSCCGLKLLIAVVASLYAGGVSGCKPDSATQSESTQTGTEPIQNTGRLTNTVAESDWRSIKEKNEQLAAENRLLRRMLVEGVNPNELDERRFGEFLYTAGQPDPDLLIRTSGEMRVSNFLLWQIAYAEIYVTETLWPDFSRARLLEAFVDYQKRERRYGGIGEAKNPKPVRAAGE